MGRKKIELKNIQPLEESFKVPEAYFDSLAEKLEARKKENGLFIQINNIQPVQETFKVPEGYFEGLMEKIEERKDQEDNVVSFRRKRIMIWGSFVAAACIAMVVLSVVNLGPGVTTPPHNGFAKENRLKNISDKEIASLLNERDDEFELTDEEIIEVIQHETKADETTAIINFLEEDGDNGDEDFLESI
jgi:hypothetical protein